MTCRLQVQHQQHQTSDENGTTSQIELQIHIVSEKFEDQPENKRRSMIEQVSRCPKDVEQCSAFDNAQAFIA